MASVENRVPVFGTAEDPAPMRHIKLGPLSFYETPEALRRICWNGTELVRAICWPIRDENWGTYPQTMLDTTADQQASSFSATLHFAVGDGRLDCQLTIAARAEGVLEISLIMTPVGGAFSTNRAGLTLLHPIEGIAGAALDVIHSDGTTENTVFPRLISPDQPVMDITGLNYSLNGQSAAIAFEGEIFEMEDQRNWSDASYKTYCVPLVYPFTYDIAEAIEQKITVSLSGTEATSSETQAAGPIRGTATDETAPKIGLAIDEGWLQTSGVIDQINPDHLRVRVTPDSTDDYLRHVATVLQGRQLDLELVLADADDPEAALGDYRRRLDAAGLHPTRVIALRAGYLGSHQPSGPWPEGPVPAEVVAASRRVFADAQIGGGMLTNFTELNRCRPDPTLCDFITHGGTAIVHASDDMSVCETLETLPQIFESAQAIGGGCAYRLGLMSIGMRSNPYGAAVAENPDLVRRTMAREDPRQQGLFAAAWAVGLLAATQGSGVEALCPAAPGGPFALTSPDLATFFPLFHVIKKASTMSGQKRRTLESIPKGVFAIGIDDDNHTSMMVANVSTVACSVTLEKKGNIATLDSTTYESATRDANWLNTAAQVLGNQIQLEPYGIAFVDINGK